jgi:NAD(P)-dependent dehydrogenase (short-subunit alcohol dehydrogenase family)
MTMTWSPDRHALRGRVAVVTGATRGAGRGIAAALGEAGATVVCFTDLDGSQPDIWRHFEATRETGRHADLGDSR